MKTERLEQAIQIFDRQARDGIFPGGQLAVHCEGNPILSHAIGCARGYRPDEAEPALAVNLQTPFPVLSVGKPLAATTIALLEERGQLDLERPLCQLLPGFKGPGKDQITTLDVLTHRSGMLMPDLVRNRSAWGKRDEIQNAIAACIPAYPRGTPAYHPHEFGWILNEIVLTVTGSSLPDYFEQEIARPLELPSLHFGLAGREARSLAYMYWLGPKRVTVAGYDVAAQFEWQNSKEFFDANNPATSLVADAESLAGFYDFLLRGGTTTEGKRLIPADRLRKYTTRNAFGWDRSLRTPLAVGRGFVVGTLGPSTFGWWNTQGCFGHGGGFSCLAFGDYSSSISAAILTNGNRNLTDFARRFLPLAKAIRSACRNIGSP